MFNYLQDAFAKHQKKLEAIAIFLLCLAISFRFENATTHWLWNDYAYIAIVLVLIVMILAVLWIRIERSKTATLIKAIKQEGPGQEPTNQHQIDTLSTRQKEVFDLIAAGKSNKEIMSELSIELSTLKTHINKIYKVLDIESRRQLKKVKIASNTP